MAFFPIDSNEPSTDKIVELLGPGALDNQLRHAIQLCWLLLPKDRRTLDEVETEVRRVLDRAFQQMRDDEAARGTRTD
jgi:hypothetical protein